MKSQHWEYHYNETGYQKGRYDQEYLQDFSQMWRIFVLWWEYFKCLQINLINQSCVLHRIEQLSIEPFRRKETRKNRIYFFLQHSFLSKDNDDQRWQRSDHIICSACIVEATLNDEFWQNLTCSTWQIVQNLYSTNKITSSPPSVSFLVSFAETLLSF